jgi:4-amino-4-deoxy-L-arabinose transferase-like glycosyltransferase
VIGVALCLGIVLRVGLVERHGLWVDEIFSLATATGHSLEQSAEVAEPRLGDFIEAPTAQLARSYRRYLEHEATPGELARIIRAVRLSDTNPPLYYVLLSLWTRLLGVSDAALRLFSVLCAVCTVPGLVYLSRRLGGRPAVLPTCLLFAASPVAIFYSTEGRMYALVWFFATTLAALTLVLSRRRAHPSALVGWVLAGAGGLLTHYFFVFIWMAGAMWLIARPGRWRRWPPWAGILMTIVVIAPWYILVPESLARWRVTGTWLHGPLSPRQTLFAPAALAWNLLSGRGLWGGSIWGEWLLLLALLSAAGGLGRRGMRWMLSNPRRLLWLSVLGACAGPVVFDFVRGTHSALIPRYALAGLPAAILLTALALGRLRPAGRLSLLILILVAWVSGIWDMFTNDSRQWQPVRQIGAALTREANSADVAVLVHSIPSGVLVIARYTDEKVLIASWVGQLHQRRVPTSVEALTAGYARVIFVKIHPVGEPAPEEEWLRAHATLVSERTHETALVASFVPRSGARFMWPARGACPDGCRRIR